MTSQNGKIEKTNWNRWFPLFVGLGVLTASLVLSRVLTVNENNHLKMTVQSKAESIKTEILRRIEPQILALARMAKRFEARKKPPKEEWEADAKYQVKHYNDYQAIEWVDSLFHVRWIVPLEGNEEAQDLDLTFEERRRVALEAARDKGDITVTRSIDLVQGGKGFLVYVPIFIDEKFNGFILGVFRIEKLLDNILNENILHGFSITLFDGEKEIYHRGVPNIHQEVEWIQETNIEFHGVSWRLLILPTKEWLARGRSFVPEAVILLGLLIAFLFNLLCRLAQKARLRERDTESINQDLKNQIIERKQAQIALQKSTIRMHAIIDNAVDGIITIDDKGIIESFNPAAERIFGYQANEVFDKNIKMLMPEPYHSQHDGYLRNYLQTGEAKIIGQGREVVGLRKDGTTLPIDLAVSEMTLGERKMFVGILRDITVIKKAQEDFQILNRQNELILNYAGEGIYGLDLNGNTTFCNPAAARMIGYEIEELIGKPQHAILHHTKPDGSPYPREECPIYAAFRDGTVHHVTHEVFWRKDGTSFPVEYVSTPIREQGELVGAVVTFKDIAQRKQMEEQLQEATQAATAASKAKSEFLANTSHEIRTPLNAITGFSNILLKMYKQKKIDKNFGEFLNIIIKSGKNLTEVIDNVLDLSKIESGKMSVEKEVFDLKVVVKSMVMIFKHSALQKGIQLVYYFDEKINNFIVSDRVKLNQILTNLLGNALKFTHRGKVILDVKRDNQVILFKVEDTGIGIPIGRLDAIFAPFEQVDSSTTRKFGGSGLGLTITKKMVDLLGGEIWVESEEAKGSRFFFTIPLEEVITEESATETIQDVVFSNDQKVLLVEDNEENLLLVKTLLREMGLEPMIAINGLEAIEQAEKFKPDLIFMDVQMPAMDGLEATRKIRKTEETKNIPIVGMSAHALKEHEAEGRRAGFNDYLTKPLDQKKLVEICRKYLKEAD